MRIISGQYKGKRITAPKRLPSRPTTDRAKEALFNILNNQYYFKDISVLDLYSGTGNISYEFASRGVAKITAVDSDSGCIQFIAKIATELALPIIPIKADVLKFLEKNAVKADVIFADPPYAMDLQSFNKISDLVFRKDLLLPHGTLVIEHPKHIDLSENPHFKDSRRYGGSAFSFFTHSDES